MGCDAGNSLATLVYRAACGCPSFKENKMRTNSVKTVPFSIRFDAIHRKIIEKYALKYKTNETEAIRAIILDWASRTEGFSSMLFFTDPDAWERYMAEIDVLRGMAVNLLNGSKAYLEYSPRLLSQVCEEAEKLAHLTDEESENLATARKLLGDGL
jgi:hypothetical protein